MVATARAIASLDKCGRLCSRSRHESGHSNWDKLTFAGEVGGTP